MNQIVDLLNGKPCRCCKLRCAVAAAERFFESAADAPERGSQIMSYRVGDVTHTIHQVLDAVEHAVDFAIEPRELIFDARDRDPPGKVACFYFPCGATDRADAMFELPAKQQSAPDREQHSHCPAR